VIDDFLQQQMTGIMGPGVRRDDEDWFTLPSIAARRGKFARKITKKTTKKNRCGDLGLPGDHVGYSLIIRQRHRRRLFQGSLP
jgi:hypothetical protein